MKRRPLSPGCVVALVCTLAALMLIAGLFSGGSGDGVFPVTIMLQSNGQPLPATVVSAVTYICPADIGLRFDRAGDPLDFRKADHLDGKYVAYVNCSNEVYFWGLWTTHDQADDLYVRVRLVDGTCLSFAFPVADKKKLQRVVIDIGKR